MVEFIDNAAIAAMAAIINNKQMMEEAERIASVDKVSINVIVASWAFDHAAAMADEHKKRFNKTVKVL